MWVVRVGVGGEDEGEGVRVNSQDNFKLLTTMVEWKIFRSQRSTRRFVLSKGTYQVS